MNWGSGSRGLPTVIPLRSHPRRPLLPICLGSADEFSDLKTGRKERNPAKGGRPCRRTLLSPCRRGRSWDTNELDGPLHPVAKWAPHVSCFLGASVDRTAPAASVSDRPLLAKPMPPRQQGHRRRCVGSVPHFVTSADVAQQGLGGP